MWNEKESICLYKCDSLRLPRWKWHWFEAHPSQEEPLVLQVRYDESKAAMEERFFRNTLGYLDDCHRQKISFSVFQLMIFFLYGEMCPGFCLVGQERLNMALNILIMYVFGFIGLLMGYKQSYDEYYAENLDKNKTE